MNLKHKETLERNNRNAIKLEALLGMFCVAISYLFIQHSSASQLKAREQ